MAVKFKIKQSYYAASTPEILRKVGDAILVAGPVLQGAVMGLPITDTTKLWIGFALTCLTVIGKVITNFFVHDSHTEEEQVEEVPAEQLPS